MRRVLGLWLLVAACSSSTQNSDAPAGGEGDEPPAAQGGSESEAGQPSAGSGASGSSSGDAGAASPTGGDAGVAAGASSGGSAGEGGALVAGAGGESVEPPVSEGGAAGDGGTDGGGGTTNPVDAVCDGKAHWSATDRWPSYDVDEQRVFAGVLWRCAAPAQCPTYPGHVSSPGWVKVQNCATGPKNETAACQCQTGTCCDGCYLRPRSHLCGEFVRTAQCLGATVNQCGGATKTIDRDWWNLFCNGDDASQCTRWGAHTKYSNGDCPANTGCVESGDQASCSACGG